MSPRKDKEKIKMYVILCCIIIIISILLPDVITKGFHKFAVYILDNGTTEEMSEAETERYLHVSQMTPTEDVEKQTEESIRYLEKEKGAAEAFLGDKTSRFENVLAEYIQSIYGSQYTVRSVSLNEQMQDDEEELSFLIEVVLMSGREETKTETFLAVYNRKYEFYSVYPPDIAITDNEEKGDD